MRNRFIFTAIMLFLLIAVTLALFELAVRFVHPQPELYPRYQASERYGHSLRESSTIVNQLPGSWRFVYNTNEYGYRVSMPQVSNRYDRPNIVILGDSSTFGIGVNDGEEYPAVLAKLLAGRADVVNLGVGSFGLTHEIRTFYEFGLLFQPSVVVLQFASNDPDDNIYEMVTVVDDGRFRFVRSRSMGGLMSQIKNWMGTSVLQRSSAYNFFRNYAYRIWRARVVKGETENDRHRKETFHNELLVAFAKDLHRRGIPLILFDVGSGLGGWPGILRQIESLDRDGLLRFLDTKEWFTGMTDYGTPEGHTWGVTGHRVAAEHLFGPVRAAVEDPKSLAPINRQLPQRSEKP